MNHSLPEPGVRDGLTSSLRGRQSAKGRRVRPESEAAQVDPDRGKILVQVGRAAWCLGAV